jgi:hypothetical protein
MGGGDAGWQALPGAARSSKIIRLALSGPQNLIRLVSECWFGSKHAIRNRPADLNQTESDDAIHDADDPEGL